MKKSNVSLQGVSTDAVDPSQNGVQYVVPASSQVFTREDLERLKARQGMMSPSLAAEEVERDQVIERKPGPHYFTIHPTYELICPVTVDPTKSGETFYLVLPDAWAYFAPVDLKTKRLVVCQSFADEELSTFVWAAPWHEDAAEPEEMHRSVARVIRLGRQGFGRARWHQRNKIYTWRAWPEQLGEQPPTLWPDQDLFALICQAFEDRVIRDGSHPIAQAQGREVVG